MANIPISESLQTAPAPSDMIPLAQHSNVTPRHVTIDGLKAWLTTNLFDQAIVFNESGSPINYRFEGDTDEYLLFTSGADDRVGIGIGAPEGKLHIAQGGATASIYLDTYSLTISQQSDLYFRKSASNTIGVAAETIHGDDLGRLIFTGVNSSNAFSNCAEIFVEQDGAAGATYVPARMMFRTGTDAASMEERIRIASDGKVGIGTVLPTALLHVAGTVKITSTLDVSGLATLDGLTSTDDINLNGGNIVMAGLETVDGIDVSVLDTTVSNHISSDGASHTFLDQSVVIGASPTLDGSNFSGIPDSAFDLDYVKVAGDEMTGDLSMNGGNIVMVGAETVDGVDVSVLNTTTATHIASDGSDHTFIDQSVVSGASPTLDGTNFSGIPGSALDTAYLPLAGGTLTGDLNLDDADGASPALRFACENFDTAYIFLAESGTPGESDLRIRLPNNDANSRLEIWDDIGGLQFVFGATGISVFNEQGNDADFRVEGVGQANALFVQGSDGFVGIGTSTPDSRLHVTGEIRLDDGVSDSPKLLLVGGTNDDTVSLFLDESGTATWSDLVIKMAGADDQARVDFKDSSDVIQAYISSIGGAVFNQAGNDANFRVEGVGQTNALFVQGSDGFVGIGTSTPSEILDVAGNINLSLVTSNAIFNVDNGALNGILWKNDVYTKFSAAIKAIETSNYARKGLGFYTGDDEDTSTDAQLRMAITKEGEVGIGTIGPSHYADLTLANLGALCMAEITTPTADTNFGKIYCKSDNKIYFQDGAGTEYTIDITPV